MKKILIVEDDKKIADLLRDYLKMGGFDVSVLYQGDRVINEVKRNPPDLIILDIMLPGKDGIAICCEIRTFSRVPIIFCTAKVDEIDRILGLEIEADDYICKPFSPREVVIRVKNILKRTSVSYNESILAVGELRINQDSYAVEISGKRLNLTPNEFALLKLMAAHPRKVFTRNDLVTKLRGGYAEGNLRNVDCHIKNLRKKIDDAAPGYDIINTVYGIGYLLDVDIKDVERKDISDDISRQSATNMYYG